MIIESDGNGGWFLLGVDDLNASVHITPEWCDEMWVHQFKHKHSPAFNTLRWHIGNGTGTADVIGDLFAEAIRVTGRRTKPAKRDTTAMREWAKEQRANR